MSILLTLGCHRQSGNLARKVRNAFPGLNILRPLTPGKRFLPDSHSAYYDSFVSALGRSLPPSLGLSRICCTCPVSGGNGRGGGWWAHPPALATLGKMALGTSVGFFGIGQSD